VRDDAVDFCEIICRKHNVRGAHILLEVLSRFRARDRYDEGTRTQALGYGQATASLAFFLRATASSADRSRRLFSILAL
jgi:capsid protein